MSPTLAASPTDSPKKVGTLPALPHEAARAFSLVLVQQAGGSPTEALSQLGSATSDARGDPQADTHDPSWGKVVRNQEKLMQTMVRRPDLYQWFSEEVDRFHADIINRMPPPPQSTGPVDSLGSVSIRQIR